MAILEEYRAITSSNSEIINMIPENPDTSDTGKRDAGQAQGAGLVSRLRAMAVRGLQRMYVPAERQFYFCLRNHPDGIAPEGRSRRYSAISLIGMATLDTATCSRILSGQTVSDVCNRLNEDVSSVDNLGDVALGLWAAQAIGYPDRARFWGRLRALRPADGAHPVVEVSWALDAACLDAANDTDHLADRLAERLMSSFPERSQVFPHVLGAAGWRSHVSCFADMVYPIHALSNYAKSTGNRKALEVATRCAERICREQGTAGQWWWHYDRRTGDVIEGYPVYAIHQDAMAPMALFALKNAGGTDFTGEIRKGLDWLVRSPEIQASLIDEKADLIWRKVARREPGKLTRYLQAAASRLHPSLRVPATNAIFPPGAIDYEDRPYHLGWLLHAWPEERAVAWDNNPRSNP
jgi:hypothetical protein